MSRYRPGGSTGLDAIVVGYHDQSELHFAAKVRAGFIPHARRELLAKLKPLQTPLCPFVTSQAPEARDGAEASAQMK